MIDWFSIYYDLHGRSSFGICTQMTGLCKKQNIEVIIYKVLQISFHFELNIRKVTYLFLCTLVPKTVCTWSYRNHKNCFYGESGISSGNGVDIYGKN